MGREEVVRQTDIQTDRQTNIGIKRQKPIETEADRD